MTNDYAVFGVWISSIGQKNNGFAKPWKNCPQAHRPCSSRATPTSSPRRRTRNRLTLSGHTHGGQFGILGLPLLHVFKYTRGMVQKGESYGYVHCGNGSWFPCRIGCPPKIAYFNLRAV